MDRNKTVRALLRKILEDASAPDDGAPLSQVDAITADGTSPTMVKLTVPLEAPRSTLADGLFPAVGTVSGANVEPLGELLVWQKAGVLETLEYAWWTDAPPPELPAARDVVVAGE